MIQRIPIIKIGDILLVTIQVELDDRLAMALREDLAERVLVTQARGVVIDISSLDLVDSFVGRILADISSVAKLLSVETVLVGMRPAVAMTLVELGLTLPGIRTALNVERGMQVLGAGATGRLPGPPQQAEGRA